MDANFKITSHHLLAVEGKDEANFFKALLEDERITGVQIANLGGKEKFRVELPLLMILEEFRDGCCAWFCARCRRAFRAKRVRQHACNVDKQSSGCAGIVGRFRHWSAKDRHFHHAR